MKLKVPYKTTIKAASSTEPGFEAMKSVKTIAIDVPDEQTSINSFIDVSGVHKRFMSLAENNSSFHQWTILSSPWAAKNLNSSAFLGVFVAFRKTLSMILFSVARVIFAILPDPSFQLFP